MKYIVLVGSLYLLMYLVTMTKDDSQVSNERTTKYIVFLFSGYMVAYSYYLFAR